MTEILSRGLPPPALRATSLVRRGGREGEGNRPLIRKQLPRLGPVLFLDVGQDDLDRVGRAAERAAGGVGELLGELAALLGRAALEHLDVDHRHDYLSLRQFLRSIDTLPASFATRAIQALTCG